MTHGIPQPLNPRDPSGLVEELSPGDRVRITTTERPRTILTVADTTSTPSQGPHLVFSVPPITTNAHEHVQHAHYHCSPSDADSSTMTVTEYPSSDTPPECIGTLTTIARLPRLSAPPTDDAPAPAPVEVPVNE